MEAHLTDYQWAELLAGSNSADEREHLAACSGCRAEEEKLRRALEDYRDLLQLSAARPEGFWREQRAAIAARLPGNPRPLLAWALAAAAVVAAAVLLLETPSRVPNVAQTDPDHALLVEVQRSVERELPRALEPAALLAQELSRAAQKTSNP